jgi:hypothetical protein
VFGSEHPSVACTHVNIGNVLRAMGRYEEALVQPHLDVLVDIEHPDVAGTHGNIGAVYGGKGNHENAKCLGKQTVAW